jgi:hypothetical protein
MKIKKIKWAKFLMDSITNVPVLMVRHFIPGGSSRQTIRLREIAAESSFPLAFSFMEPLPLGVIMLRIKMFVFVLMLLISGTALAAPEDTETTGKIIVQDPGIQKTEVNITSKIITPEPAANSFTGLIVDARSLGLENTFSPVIYDETGKPVYGIKEIDTSLAMTRGMVDYAPTPDLVQEAQSGKSRAGTQPMIIKAIGLKDNNHNIIISTTDAEKILTANQSTNFLNKCAVVFLN